MRNIFEEIQKEIELSEKKHGLQYHIPSLDPILIDRGAQRMAEEYEVPTATRAKFKTDTATERGELTQAHIVIEELCEAIECMKDEAEMRKELIQLACTVIKWIKTIDYKKQQND